MSKRKQDSVKSQFYDRFGSPRRRNQSADSVGRLVGMYERILGELSMNRFKWEGMPASDRFIEKTLHQHGLIVVFKDTGTAKRPGTDRMFAMRATPHGKYDMNENPTAYTLSGPGMSQHFQGLTLSARRCVPVWCNYYRMTDQDVVEIYARRLAEIDRTIDINLKGARRPKVLVYDENTRLSVQNINDQIDNGDTVIAVKTDLAGVVTSVDLGIEPRTITELSVIRSRIWSEAMGLMGIDNANQDKKERLVEAEVSANDDQTDNMRFVSLSSREYACGQINKMFPGMNVSVEYRAEHAQRMKDQYERALGINDANIHD